MMFYNLSTYGDFLKMPERIATNILADRLEKLEKAGLITKEEHPESKAKLLYKLTPMGVDLLPVMTEVGLWADKYFKISEEAKAIVRAAKKDKKEFLRTLSSQLSKKVKI
jgi:DNA-binding HxlR family transcriptional regulator